MKNQQWDGSPGVSHQSTDRIRAMVRSVIGVLAFLGVADAVSHAAMQEAAQYPNRPMRVIVTGPAGGPTDVVARAVGESLSETFGQLVIDNRADAAGMIGAEI